MPTHLAFFQPFVRYKVLRNFRDVSAEEVLVFVQWDCYFDHFMGFNCYRFIFAEKDLLVDDMEWDAEILNFPERFFMPMAPSDPTDSLQRLQARRERQQAEQAEESRQEILRQAQRKLEKHQRKR